MFRFAAVVTLLGALSLTAGADDEPKATGKAGKKGKLAGKYDADRLPEMILERFDTNKDGKLSKAEAPDRMKDRFAELDKNKDGFLDKDELKAMARMFAQAAKGKFGDKLREKLGAAVPAGNDFNTFDKDADGRITRAEAQGTSLEKDFDKIDTSKDGKIDPKEFAAYRKG
jgi:hypothetical protein